MKPDSNEEKPVTDDVGNSCSERTLWMLTEEDILGPFKWGKIQDEIRRVLLQTKCAGYTVQFASYLGRLLFSSYKRPYCLSHILVVVSLNSFCCFYAVYFAWKLIFLVFPYLWQLEKEEERRREDELQKERERVLLERRQKEEENQFIKQVRGKRMFRCCCCCCFFICCGCNQFNLWRVVNVFPYPFVFRRRRNKKWKGRGKKKKRRLVSVTRLNLIL